jgi:hypothetical protein
MLEPESLRVALQKKLIGVGQALRQRYVAGPACFCVVGADAAAQ